MERTTVSEAFEAFRQGDYATAIHYYRQASAAIGSDFFRANIDICRARYFRAKACSLDEKDCQDLVASASGQPKNSDYFRVALIADEFTTNSFENEFQAVSIEPSNWREKFEEWKPDIFFCESAWSGPDPKVRPWKGKIYASENFSKENRTTLLEILDYCRKTGIPTVFWNKEDPTHHSDRIHDFVKTAKEFDFVFTTAEECIDSYKREYGIKNAFVLPFATNPRLFNPVETCDRSSRVVFAGSWYANHVDRCRDMERILDSIQDEGFELDIYDRYHGDTDPLHVWPEKYQTYLRPAKPHDQMPAVYKSSRFGLNINTVTNSPTMFARRVFELMSCNTLVLSNHALGTERIFGDLIVYPERERGRLRSLTSSEVEDLRARALAKVLSEHTYRHRWNAVLQNIGVPHRPRQETITVVAMVHQQDDALAALAWFQQFGGRLPGGRLLLVAGREMEGLAVADIYRRFNRFGVTVTSASHATRYAMLDRYKPVETTHFLVLDLKAPPSAQWLAHARLHLQYWTGYPIAPSQDQSQQYRFGRVAPQSTLIDRQCAFGNWLEEYSNSRNVYFV